MTLAVEYTRYNTPNMKKKDINLSTSDIGDPKIPQNKNPSPVPITALITIFPLTVFMGFTIFNAYVQNRARPTINNT